MLVREVMSSKVITVSSNTSVGEAQLIMREHNFRRLPVVDNGRVVGMVTERRLERVKPKTSTPLLWQITYLISRTTVRDVMRKKVVIVSPTDTVEKAIAKAQSGKVGTLLVMDKGELVGICTTNDFFYKIVNSTLGLGKTGTRILVTSDNIGPAAQKIVDCVNKLGIAINVMWAVPGDSDDTKNIILHLEVENAGEVIKELEKLGYNAIVLAR
ncbi:CBS domain-containing protein [Chloroflexota bacterium]